MHLDWWTIGLQTINFGILVWLLNRFLYRPVLAMIDARKADIQHRYDDAKAADERAKADLGVVAAARDGMSAEREAVVRAAAAKAQEAAEAVRQKAAHDAQLLIEGARKTLAAERERALGEARTVALDLAAEFAQRLLAAVPTQLRADAWIEQIERYFLALPERERHALGRQLADGAALTVVTASALPAATAETWRDRLRHMLGDGVDIRFTADPALIAGAELHFPTAVLRFSWQDALAALRSEVGGHGDAR